MDRIAILAEARTFRTPNGNVRYVARDDDGNEYTTFRTDVGKRAMSLQGRRVRIEFHEERRGRFDNTYLDQIQPAEDAEPADAGHGSDTEPSEAAWRTAVSAAPWLVGEPAEHEVPPQALYERLKPFQDRVANDIEKGAAANDSE